MTAYAISGTMTPDCSTANTGEPAGTLNGQSYWSWLSGEITWYLQYEGPSWYITNILEGGDYLWQRTGESPAGTYTPYVPEVTGNVTVAEVVVGSTYAALQILDGPNAGKFIVLKTG